MNLANNGGIESSTLVLGTEIGITNIRHQEQQGWKTFRRVSDFSAMENDFKTVMHFWYGTQIVRVNDNFNVGYGFNTYISSFGFINTTSGNHLSFPPILP